MSTATRTARRDRRLEALSGHPDLVKPPPGPVAFLCPVCGSGCAAREDAVNERVLLACQNPACRWSGAPGWAARVEVARDA